MAFDKTKPAGTTPLKTSDDQIRANNEALETAIGQDHDFATGGTQTGKHKQVIFKAPITKPSLAADEGALFTKTVSTKSELVYEDEDGDEVQITDDGHIASDVKIGTTSRISMTAGDQAITGIGFKPRLVTVWAFAKDNLHSDGSFSLGMDDGSQHLCMYREAGSSAEIHFSNTDMIHIVDSYGDSMKGKISAFGADGFTITWTEDGRYSNTKIYMIYKAER